MQKAYVILIALILFGCKSDDEITHVGAAPTEEAPQSDVTLVKETPRQIASRLFQRLAGVPLLLSDSRRANMESLIAAGNLREAAAIATQDENFLNITIKQWATPWMNRDNDQFEPLNDGVATVIGIVRDFETTGSFAQVLSANVTYSAPNVVDADPLLPDDNDHYISLENDQVNLAQNLVRAEQSLPEFAGVLTSRAWGAAHVIAGTNRRAVQRALQEFLCRPILSLADTTLPDSFVRKDVNRMPGGLLSTYQNKCKGCHAPMDAIGGAFAKFEYVDAQLRHADDGGPNDDNADDIEMFANGVAAKMNRTPEVYDGGRATTDSYWENLMVGDATVGWQGATKGEGVREFGQMLARSDAFYSCMAKRAFETICSREAVDGDAPVFARVGQVFRESGGNARRLFEEVAILPSCTQQSKPATEEK